MTRFALLFTCYSPSCSPLSQILPGLGSWVIEGPLANISSERIWFYHIAALMKVPIPIAIKKNVEILLRARQAERNSLQTVMSQNTSILLFIGFTAKWEPWFNSHLAAHLGLLRSIPTLMKKPLQCEERPKSINEKLQWTLSHFPLAYSSRPRSPSSDRMGLGWNKSPVEDSLQLSHTPNSTW